MTTDFRIETAWRDTVAAARSGLPVFLPIAAAFALLPSLATALLGPPQPQTTADLTANVVLVHLIIPAVIGTASQMTIAKLVIEAKTGTSQPVGAVLRLALLALPGLVAALFLTAAPVMAGLLLLVVPGIYMAARLSLALPLIIEERVGPVAALFRSWALTEGNGFRVLGFQLGWLLVFLLGSVIAGGLGAALASVLTVLGAKTIGSFVALLISGIAAMIFNVYNGVGSGVLYLHLTDKR